MTELNRSEAYLSKPRQLVMMGIQQMLNYLQKLLLIGIPYRYAYMYNINITAQRSGDIWNGQGEGDNPQYSKATLIFLWGQALNYFVIQLI